MGRPSKLNEEIIEKLSDEIADGLPFRYACELNEITETLGRMWLSQGKFDIDSDVESLHAKFFVRVKKAYAQFIKDSKGKIRKGESGWQGVAWWLERTNREFTLNNENDSVGENIVINPGMTKKAAK